MTAYEALSNLTTFLTTPGADKWSRRGCTLISKYLLEADMRGFATFSLAYNPAVKEQYGSDVVNDLAGRSIDVIRGANRLYALTALLETNFDHPVGDSSVIEGFRHIISDELPNLAARLTDLSKLARSIMHTVEV